MISGGDDNEIVKMEERARSWAIKKRKYGAHPNPQGSVVSEFCISPDFTIIVSCSDYDEEVKVWNMDLELV